MKMFALAASIAAGGFIAVSHASAAPGPGPTRPGVAGDLVDHVQAFRRDCVWVNEGWRYRRGGSYVACRPYRPKGPGWIWYREGPRYGWYHRGQKRWNYDRW